DAIGRFADVEELLRLRHAALDALPPGHAERGKRLAQLSNALQEFGGALNTPSIALDEGIAIVRKSLTEPGITGSDRGSASTSLGSALLARYKLTRAPADLDDAVHTLELAAALATDDQPDRTAGWATLGVALRFRFDAIANRADLTEAIWLQRAAVN